jgi:hypothetical protein
MLFAVTVEPDSEHALTPRLRTTVDAADKDAALGDVMRRYRRAYPLAGHLNASVNRVRGDRAGGGRG